MPLSAVCSDNERFLQNRKSGFEICSLNDIIVSLILVHDGIHVVNRARSLFGDSFIIAQGEEIGLQIDELFIANYEHMLLQIQGELMEALMRKVIEALLWNDLDKTRRKLLRWFSEFPDSQRPLSTTWPWAIKPSLAVLWGYVDAIFCSSVHVLARMDPADW